MALRITWDIDEKPFDLRIVAVGQFAWYEPMPEEHGTGWTDFNGVYLVWPYLRQYVNTITSLSSLRPLVLPTLAVPRPDSRELNTEQFDALLTEPDAR